MALCSCIKTWFGVVALLKEERLKSISTSGRVQGSIRLGLQLAIDSKGKPASSTKGSSLSRKVGGRSFRPFFSSKSSSSDSSSDENSYSSSSDSMSRSLEGFGIAISYAGLFLFALSLTMY